MSAINRQLVDILSQLLTPELAAKGETNSAGRQLEERGRVDVQVKRRNL